MEQNEEGSYTIGTQGWGLGRGTSPASPSAQPLRRRWPATAVAGWQRGRERGGPKAAARGAAAAAPGGSTRGTRRTAGAGSRGRAKAGARGRQPCGGERPCEQAGGGRGKGIDGECFAAAGCGRGEERARARDNLGGGWMVDRKRQTSSFLCFLEARRLWARLYGLQGRDDLRAGPWATGLGFGFRVG
jgi:hypothetical protein